MNDQDLQQGDWGRTGALATATAGDPPLEVYDCWKTIGVEGNGTCRQLQACVHCRNCPVYCTAGLQLLNCPLPVDYRREWTEHFAQHKTPPAPARTSVVVFRIGREWLALPTHVFQEVAERRTMHTLPHRRQGVVLGLVNVRGELLVCVSVGRLLGLGQAVPPDGPRAACDRLLVVNCDGHRLAFPVDEVPGTQRLHPHDLKEPPATLSKSALTYTQGTFAWRERTVGFLDADLLFSTLNRSLT